MRIDTTLVILAIVGAFGCGDKGSSTSSSSSGGSGATSSSSGGVGGGGTGTAELPPLGGAALLTWLEAKTYTKWKSESKPHASTGPHGSKVLSFVNAALFDSLPKMGENAKGSAAVKELFNTSDMLIGWAVAIKTADSSDAGKNWYWYEIINKAVVADEAGKALCVNCHSTGAKDYFKSPVPLQ
jgi:hypothetical protein